MTDFATVFNNEMKRNLETFHAHLNMLMWGPWREEEYKRLYGPLFIVAPNGDCWRIIRDPRRMLPNGLDGKL